MKIKFLGTGTSQGVPPIGCMQPVCLSDDPRDRRLRTSALITTGNGKKILIDCGPDFRQQMLSNRESDVHAVLITHEHNDHVIGLDDLRPLIFKNETDMPIYAMDRVGRQIRERFPYAFADVRYPGAPSFQLHAVCAPFSLLNEEVTPILLQHGKIDIYGYRIRNLAYITDGSHIPDTSVRLLQGLDTLVVNCLRREMPHPSHFILPEVLQLVEKLRPRRAILTHMSHEIGFHRQLCEELPSTVQPAYDGLEVEF